jgi:hypothetical protein
MPKLDIIIDDIIEAETAANVIASRPNLPIVFLFDTAIDTLRNL